MLGGKDCLEIQGLIQESLEGHDYYPLSIIFTFADHSKFFGGLLSITFYYQEDYSRFLESLVEIKNLCDTSGFDLFPDTNTVLIHGISLIRLINKLKS